MKKSIFLAVAISISVAQFANATTVTFASNASTASVVNSNLSTVATGSFVLLGTFANTNFSLGSDPSITNDWTAIQSAGGWSQFDGTKTTVTSTGAQRIGFNATDGSAAANPFNGKQAYLVIFNATTIAGATQMGIYNSVPWVFPTNTNNNPIGSDSIAFSTLTVPNGGVAISAVGATPVGSYNGSQFVLSAPTAVPEPTTFALGAMIGFAGLGMRRRQRR